MHTRSNKGGSKLNSSGLLKMKCRNVTGENVAGKVLISKDAINFYLVDPDSGKIIEEGHSSEGDKIGGKVLIFPTDKGSSVVQLDGLYLASLKGNKPKAFIVQELTTVLVSNSIIMEIPLICSVEEKFYQTIKNGDWIEIDSEKEEIIIHPSPK